MFASGLSAYQLYRRKPLTWGQEATVENLGLLNKELVTRRLGGNPATYGNAEPLMELRQTFIDVSPQARTTARAALSYPGVPYAPSGWDFTNQSI